MSRIFRYIQSMDKFIKTKSCIKSLDGNLRLIFENITYDNLVSTILLTVMNNQSKQLNLSLHGYYISTGIELLLLIQKINDSKDYYDMKIGENNIKKISKIIPCMVNICLTQNIEHIQTKISKEKALKIYYLTNKILNEKIIDLVSDSQIVKGDVIKKSDIPKYNFDDIKNPKEKLHKLKQITKESLLKHINIKYGSVCQIALICGWLLGGGNNDEKYIASLEKVGLYLGNIFKISLDFVNLERDLINTNADHSYNYVINYGIQEAFELFIDQKIKFIEGCMLLNIYNNNITIKEVIDVIEKNVEDFIDKTTADLQSQYTLSVSTK